MRALFRRGEKEGRKSRLRYALTIIGASALLAGSVITPITLATQAEPAHSHTADLKATSVCINGDHQVTFTLTLANVPQGATAKVEVRTGGQSFHHGWNKSTWSDWTTKATNVPSTQSTVTWTTTLSGSTTGNGPWEYAVTTWSNGHVVKSDTRPEGLKDCGPSHEVTCDTAWYDTGGPLKNGEHINIDLRAEGKSFQANAYVDLNHPTGWNGLGVRIKVDGVEKDFVGLTQDEVQSGILRFDFAQWLPYTEWTVEWAQLFDVYFNQDRNPQKFLECDREVASATVVKTAATCDIAETASAGTMVNAELVSATGTTGPGTAVFVFSRTGDALFPPGDGVSSDRKTLTIEKVLGDKLGGCNQPDPKVTYSEWDEGDWVCGETSVVTTRSKTITPFIWVGGEWVEDTDNAVTTTEVSSRELTQEEIDEKCAIEIPVTPPPTAATCDTDGKLPKLVSTDEYTASWDRAFNGPGEYTAIYEVKVDNTYFKGGLTTLNHKVTVSKKTGNCRLAETGGGALPALAAGGVLLLLGGGMVAAMAIRRRA